MSEQKLTSKNTRGKLTVEQVAEIRTLVSSGMTNKAIADRFGVSPSVISGIVCNISYRIPKRKPEVAV